MHLVTTNSSVTALGECPTSAEFRSLMVSLTWILYLQVVKPTLGANTSLRVVEARLYSLPGGRMM